MYIVLAQHDAAVVNEEISAVLTKYQDYVSFSGFVELTQYLINRHALDITPWLMIT